MQTLVFFYLMLFRSTLRAASHNVALARVFVERLPTFVLERQVLFPPLENTATYFSLVLSRLVRLANPLLRVYATRIQPKLVMDIRGLAEELDSVCC